jgi:nucleotide-binding universal stress UspA family protein
MGRHSGRQPVVVGVDESASTAALRWAVDEARRRGAPLRIVHALDQSHTEAFIAANPVFVADERRAAEQVLETAVGLAREWAPDLDVRPVLEVGPSAVVLLGQVPSTDLVVVGCRGRGGFAGLLLGSTSLNVAMHASGVVVVVRPVPDGSSTAPSAGRVVVGVDGSPSSACALRFAFTRARRRGLGLTAVRAWRSPAVYVDVPSSRVWELAEKEEQAQLSDDLAAWREQYPEVDVVERTPMRNAGAALAEESAGAELLVVGSRGRGGLAGLVLGSVSHAALHHARCPVAVVRPERRGD